MRSFKSDKLRNVKIKPHNIIFAYTTPINYDMSRLMLVEDIGGYDEYLLLNEYHCSYYGFDDCTWKTTVYTKEELIKLANADYNKNNVFWQMVKDYFNVTRG